MARVSDPQKKDAGDRDHVRGVQSGRYTKKENRGKIEMKFFSTHGYLRDGWAVIYGLFTFSFWFLGLLFLPGSYFDNTTLAVLSYAAFFVFGIIGLFKSDPGPLV